MKRKFKASDDIVKAYYYSIFQPLPIFYGKKITIARKIAKYCADKRRKLSSKISFIEDKLTEYIGWCEKNNKTVEWTRFKPLKPYTESRGMKRWLKNFWKKCGYKK